jgi:PPOX class probable F420-dependent enzyme
VTGEEARRHFSEARVGRIATADASGRPHAVPVVFAVEGDHIYSAVDQKPKRTPALRRLANIAANPAVTLLVDHYEEDWGRLWWVRADGRGRILDPDDDGEARHGIELLKAKYPQQSARGAVLVIDVDRWSGWSSRGSGAPREPPTG